MRPRFFFLKPFVSGVIDQAKKVFEVFCAPEKNYTVKYRLLTNFVDIYIYIYIYFYDIETAV